jgi:outer membrane assembly lipoprotein YfiO
MAAAWLLACAVPCLHANNTQANAEFLLGQEQLRAGNSAAAGQHFDRANFYADDPVLKANALKAAADAFQKAGDPIREAAALRQLTSDFAGHADYVPAMRRQYELASRDYQRSLRLGGAWFPWQGQAADRAIEAYESLLAQAQFAEFTPELRVRLGRMYLEKSRISEALQQWRDVTRLYPGSPEERYAWFELANALVQLAENGDGDGTYGREAQETMHRVIEKYPDDPDTVWAREKIRVADTFAAQRLYDLGRFYHGSGNDEAAIRYLHELLAAYPKSPVATEAEKLLTDIDLAYTPPATPVAGRNEVVRYPVGKLPEEPEEVLVPVGKSDGKWLLPVEDLDIKSWRRPNPDP